MKTKHMSELRSKGGVEHMVAKVGTFFGMVGVEEGLHPTPAAAARRRRRTPGARAAPRPAARCASAALPACPRSLRVAHAAGPPARAGCSLLLWGSGLGFMLRSGLSFRLLVGSGVELVFGLGLG